LSPYPLLRIEHATAERLASHHAPHVVEWVEQDRISARGVGIAADGESGLDQRLDRDAARAALRTQCVLPELAVVVDESGVWHRCDTKLTAALGASGRPGRVGAVLDAVSQRGSSTLRGRLHRVEHRVEREIAG